MYTWAGLSPVCSVVWSVLNEIRRRARSRRPYSYKIKRDGNENIQCYKARLVAKECLQKKGKDFNETYAPVARIMMVRIILALIGKENLYIIQIDVKNAFLHGIIRKEIYIKIPEEIVVNPETLCKLNKPFCKLNNPFERIKQASCI